MKKSFNIFILAVLLVVGLIKPSVATLPLSCQEDGGDCFVAPDGNAATCTPRDSAFEPPGVGQVWLSQCCTVSETSTDTPPVTTSKMYCWLYTLVGFANNLHSGIRPTCSENGSGSTSWKSEGQCYIATGAENPPYSSLTAIVNPDGGSGCPEKWDSSSSYENGDLVEDNEVVYACTGGLFCNYYQPDLMGVGLAYWDPTNSCTGTIQPTTSPTFATTAAGCPEEYDAGTAYKGGDQISVSLPDGRSTMYECKEFPASQWCNVASYSPLNTAEQCNGEVCWPAGWTYLGGCTGTISPTQAPSFAAQKTGDLDGCPLEFIAGTDYEEGDQVSIALDDTYGKIYQCREWPNYSYCKLEAYRPGVSGGVLYNGEPLWTEAWTYVGGCTGTGSPTQSPTFLAAKSPATIGGCPLEFIAGTEYEQGDRVSIALDDTYGKIYQCRVWPNSEYCKLEAYKPGPGGATLPNGNPLWTEAWTYVEGCTGTGSPTVSPTFETAKSPATIVGCPLEYVAGTEYEENDEVSIALDDTYSKVYKCRGWPQTGFCKLEAYKPGVSGGVLYNGEPLWKQAWTYVGGCTGTITPTTSPMFQSIPQWDMEGCPDAYVPNNPDYQAGDYVSVPKNEDNTYGVVWQCKNGLTWPWCRSESYAPGTRYGGDAWQQIGHCAGTMSPTDPPTLLSVNPNPSKRRCEFKYKLTTTTGGEYVVLQAESWVDGGRSPIATTGGVPLTFYKTGQLVRYGSEAHKCNNYPYSGYCNQYSPFPQDSSNYNSILSSLGWSEVTAGCEDIVSVTDTSDKGADEFDPTNFGPLFASNGNLLVDAAGACQTGDDPFAASGATNAEDYFKTQPTTALPCQQCPASEGFDNPETAEAATPTVCSACMTGTTSTLVNRRSECVCDNGATDPWDLDTAGGGATAANQCNTCSGGKKFLGHTHGDGTGLCVDACPVDKPTYVKVDHATDGYSFYFVCCTDSTCGDDGSNNALVANCYDATTDDSVCTPAIDVINTT